MKAIILAGGKGTRLSALTQTTPKPMILLHGKPILQYQIELLKKNNITDITLVTNYLSGVIKDYFRDGKKFGVSITYFEEKTPLGTAGSIREIAQQSKDDFLLLYGDLLINMDIQRFINFHKKHKGIATLVTHPNNHPFDSDLIDIDLDNKITAFYAKPHREDFIYHNLVNAAVYAMSPSIHKFIPEGKSSDFGHDIFPNIINQNEEAPLYSYKTHEYVKDIGTMQRLHEAEDDIVNQTYKLGSINYKRRAIFFDRDGVINKEVDNIIKIEDVELIPNAAKALKKVNNSLFLAIVITNQPQAAKGFCSVNDIENINKKVETLLGEERVKIDGLYICLHHPEKGFPDEDKKYKIECECRKPKIGLLTQAVKDFNINLSKSYFVGDTTTDAMTAQNINIPFIGVKTGYGCKDKKFDIKANLLLKDINYAVDYILEQN